MSIIFTSRFNYRKLIKKKKQVLKNLHWSKRNPFLYQKEIFELILQKNSKAHNISFFPSKGQLRQLTKL